jgi:hypothetical protein
MEPRERSTSNAGAFRFGRLSLMLVVSTLAIAALWHVLYGATMLTATAVVAEIGVMLVLAFAYAWRSTR